MTYDTQHWSLNEIEIKIREQKIKENKQWFITSEYT